MASTEAGSGRDAVSAAAPTDGVVPGTPRGGRASAAGERVQLALAGAALLAVYAIATTSGPFADITVNDLYVYGVYAHLLHAGNLPYADFPFEYPPLAALPIWLAGAAGLGAATYEASFAVLMGLCLLAGQQLAARLAGGGREGVMVAWLLVATPVLIGASLRTHFDALPIVIAIAGLAALVRGRTDLAFALLAVGTMTKLFPGLLAVVALAWLAGARGERRAALRGAAVFAVVAAAIVLPVAGSGYVDSLRFHLDRPVQIESTPASVLFALGGSEVTGTNLRPDRFKSNGLDGGHAGSTEALFSVLAVLAFAAIALLAARRPEPRHVVLSGFAALLAFVALGKVLSPQFVIWLAPFAAIAWAWGERAVALLCAAAIALTQVEFPSRYFDLINVETGVVLIVAARNALLLATLAVLMTRLGRRAS